MLVKDETLDAEFSADWKMHWSSALDRRSVAEGRGVDVSVLERITSWMRRRTVATCSASNLYAAIRPDRPVFSESLMKHYSSTLFKR